MKNKYLILLVSLIVSVQSFAQTATCDGSLPFEEKDGILTIEMESGILPSGSDWQTGSEEDPNLEGSTINYIFWNGTESFSSLSGAPITYNIKINNPGTYRFAWRGRIGKGTSGGEHNDTWVKIVADDFYATKSSSSTSTTQVVEPKPSCNSNPERNCPAGSSTGGFFKAYMNRHPVNRPINERWGFVTNTNDHDAFRFIWATFNTAGNYSIIVDARSSSFFIDKMVLRRTNVSDSAAFNLNNTESSCFDASLSTKTINKQDINVFPNPTTGKIELKNLPENTRLTVSNVLGAKILELTSKTSSQVIDLSSFKNGVYYISSNDKNNHFVKRIVKM
jgi:hypothetical protein